MSKIKSFSLCFFVFLIIVIGCNKETSNTLEESNSTVVNNTPNNTSNTEEDTIKPNLNESSLIFEEIEVTFLKKTYNLQIDLLAIGEGLAELALLI